MLSNLEVAMKRKSRNLINICLLISICVLIAVVVINILWDTRPRFLDASIGQILSTIVVILFSYFLVQLRTDDRKQADITGKVIEKAEQAYSEYVNSITKVIEVQKASPYNGKGMDFSRKQMLSQKKKLDAYVSLLKDLRSTSKYTSTHSQLTNELSQYHELFESLPVSGESEINPDLLVQLENKENLVMIKFVMLYTEAYNQ